MGKNLRKRHLEARAKAGIGIKEWPANAMRHSFVSYRLAQTKDDGQTAMESGHSQAILYAHYGELVKPTQAEKYWVVKP